MGDTPTENFLKRHQHWLLAILSALLLFLSFPNVNLYPFAWIAMVPFFIALTQATGWRFRILDRLLNRFSVFRRIAPCHRPTLSVRGYLHYDSRLSTPCRLYGALFCSFCRTDEGCAGAFRRTISACRCLHLDSIGMGAELDDNRIPVGQYWLFAME